jgi:hypothetical protein
LFLELLDLVLEIDDIIAIDEFALAGVVVFALGVCPVAGTAFGECRITSCFALRDDVSVRSLRLDGDVGVYGPTTLHLVHAVRVCATVEVVLELEASLAPSFLRLVRPVMP